MRFTNIKLIMDRLTRHPLLQDIPFETVVDYTVDFIRIVGTPPSFLDKTAIIDIVDYRGILPCDYYEMTQVRLNDGSKRTFRYTTDSFHMSDNKPELSDLTYKIQGNCIFTAPLEQGQIEIAYQAMPMDEEGYPLIPDNSSYSRALEAYIKREWFTILFDQGKLNGQVLARADQEYSFYVGQAQSEIIMPTIDQMEAISNMWNTLLPRDEHRHGFLDNGTQSHIINH